MCKKPPGAFVEGRENLLYKNWMKALGSINLFNNNPRGVGKVDGEVHGLFGYGGPSSYRSLIGSNSSAGRGGDVRVNVPAVLPKSKELALCPWANDDSMGVDNGLVTGKMIKDMGFSREKFTWSNSRGSFANVHERLDRRLVCSGWCDSFQDYRLSHLEIRDSDHRDLLLDLFERRVGLSLVPCGFERIRMLNLKVRKYQAVDEDYENSKKWKNRIKGLEDANGVWREDDRSMTRIVTLFYEDLFTSNGVDWGAISTITADITPVVTNELNDELNRPFKVDEIEKALASVRGMKEPRLNGFHFVLYHRC
ncbi:hypothetical protein F8388_017541 [Cannabis sativa]|uniref:Uncharacterized protein n=1 Tax=Cannabis sativa TaxID=3483 RepID=A0A7J6I9G5_CANSA|nr:hypothetical protein F8388_017541 [Cannabis sativa]KAF4403698.1 hypothetical protein G4B88_002551 [Cannabis sativa]